MPRGGSVPLILQNDDTSMQARRLVTVLKTLSSSEGNQKIGLELLKGWDAHDTAVDLSPA